MRYSLYFPILFSVWLFCLPLPALFIYYVDPYQVFHKHTSPDLGLTHNQRYQNAGLINSYLNDPTEHYDSILVGTSLSANFTGNDLQKSLHWQRPLRLLMEGGNPKEQSILVQHALDTKKIEHILWELFPRFYYSSVNDVSTDSKVFPDYLYNNNPFDNYPYLFNQDVLAQSWYAWKEHSYLFSLNAETIGYWGDNPAIEEQHKNFNSADNIIAALNPGIDTSIEMINANELFHYPVLEEETFPVIDKVCNSNTEIVFFIPPLSKLDYLGGGTEYPRRVIYMPRFILQKIAPCKNISLHAFDLMGFANDLNHYKDREHYLPYINVKMLDLISRNESQLTLNNVTTYETDFRKILNEKQITSSYHEPP